MERVFEEYKLCDDIGDYIRRLCDRETCQRCGVDVVTERRISMCIIGETRLCFSCCHFNRYVGATHATGPSPEQQDQRRGGDGDHKD